LVDSASGGFSLGYLAFFPTEKPTFLPAFKNGPHENQLA